MATSRTPHMIRIRLAVASLVVVGLAIADLNSGIAHFAVVVRDRAKSDLANPVNCVADNTFSNLMDNALIVGVLGALASISFAILGIVLTICPKWLPRHDKRYVSYGVIQFMLCVGLIALGGYLADKVHGYRSSFARFDRDDDIPYYEIMYYGGISQAGFGALVILGIIIIFFA